MLTLMSIIAAVLLIVACFCWLCWSSAEKDFQRERHRNMDISERYHGCREQLRKARQEIREQENTIRGFRHIMRKQGRLN